MPIQEDVLCAIECAEERKIQPALTLACAAIDATATRLYPHMAGAGRVGERYRACLRQYSWIIEPMIGGLALETKFSNLKLEKAKDPDLFDTLYELFRCYRAHGQDIPQEFSLISCVEGNSIWYIAEDRLHIPDSIIWALLAIVVFSKVNITVQSEGDHFFLLGGDKFLIRDWWGREDDFRPFASKHNQCRVKLDDLGTQAEASSPQKDDVAFIIIKQP